MAKTADQDQPTRPRIYKIDRDCMLCGSKIADMGRRTICQSCWRDAMKAVYGDIRAQELADQGMYQRIDD